MINFINYEISEFKITILFCTNIKYYLIYKLFFKINLTA